jgi:single-strand DNA-binding protein
VPRFELGTSPTRTERATRLRHTPNAAHRLAGSGTNGSQVCRYVAVTDNGGGTGMNSVILTGNLASDVELREFGEDKRLATFRLAVDRPSKTDEADFFRIAAWDQQAQLCADYLSKGRKIGVEGRLRYRTWEDGDEKRSSVEVVAHRIEFLGSRSAESDGEVVPFEAAVA